MLERMIDEFYMFILKKQIKTGNYIALYNDGELVDTIKR